jgi:arginase family enzyme
MAVFMPEPDGLTLDEAERILRGIRERTSVLGAGLTGASFEPGNGGSLSRLVGALGL